MKWCSHDRRAGCGTMTRDQAARESPSIRPDWFFGVVEACQHLACKAELPGARGHLTLLKSVVACLEPPTTLQEQLALDHLLADAVLHLARREPRPPAPAGLGGEAPAAVSASDASQARRALIQHLAAHPPSPVPVARPLSLAERAKAILDCEFAKPLTVLDVAERLACHPKRLERLFRKAYGVTLHQYLDGVRLRNGEQLLRDTDDKVESIAQAAGWQSRTAFALAFSKACGVSPSEYRRLARRGSGGSGPDD